MANNYFCTGRPNLALEILSVVKKSSPDNLVLQKMMHKVFCLSVGQSAPNLDDEFGALWQGESLEGKSIEIFCDQGIGDTLNLLRYVKLLKEKYNCQIVLNCYAFYETFERFIKTQNYIDFFVKTHKKCDFCTNIMSIPALINNLKLEIYYPVHFKEVMKCEIPPQISVETPEKVDLQGKIRVGVVWQSNSINTLSAIKSLPVEKFYEFYLPDTTFFCLQPDTEPPDWIQKLQINDLQDTVNYIKSCDCVISVDTAVLHLAGILGKKTFGLIPYDSDPRWGKSINSVWYPSAELFRQTKNGSWSKAISKIKHNLANFVKNL